MRKKKKMRKKKRMKKKKKDEEEIKDEDKNINLAESNLSDISISINLEERRKKLEEAGYLKPLKENLQTRELHD